MFSLVILLVYMRLNVRPPYWETAVHLALRTRGVWCRLLMFLLQLLLYLGYGISRWRNT